jgi:hypothetical protein
VSLDRGVEDEELVISPLVIAFVVVVRHELANRPA